MTDVNSVLLGVEGVVDAVLQASTGVAVPGAPAATAVIGKIAGNKITFNQAVTASKVFAGSDIGTVFTKIVTGKGTVADDLDVTAEVATGLADLGVPYANDAVLALDVAKFGYTMVQTGNINVTGGEPDINSEESPLNRHR